MTKFAKIKYSEVETKKINENETSFTLQPLERGFANTFGNAIRRVLLSSVSGVAPFALKVEGVDHEFQTIPGVTEDAVQLILNLKDVRFKYNEEVFPNDEVVKITLNSKKGIVDASSFNIPAGIELVDEKHYIATTSKNSALKLELFLTSGRGFVSFEENKETIKNLGPKIESDITNGKLIAMDSDFSPVVNVSHESVELNSSSAIIEEKLTLNIKTNGMVDAKTAVSQASHIMIEHLEMLANVSNLEKEKIFAEEVIVDESSKVNAMPIAQLDLSVRSYNCLRRAGLDTLEDLSKLTVHELENIKNLGKKSVDEIIDKLAKQDIILEEGN